jgi:enoyl-CoA hydratase/carnithine racemase
MMTGRVIAAPRARATGQVSEVVPDADLEAAGEALVAELLATSPIGLRMTKEGLNFAIDAPSLEAAIALENRNQLMCAASDDFKEGLAAFLEKRAPNYGI